MSRTVIDNLVLKLPFEEHDSRHTGPDEATNSTGGGVIVQDRINIPDETLAEICRRYQVRELAIFGSVLRDDFQDDSDIDILVEFEADARIGFFELARLQREFAALFGRDVDVVPKGGLNPVIRTSVLEAAVVLYAN